MTFTATGEVQLSNDANDNATPDGSLRGRYPSAPLRQVLAGALIGRIGTGSMFGIGNQTVPLPMPADGRLFLGVNDDGLAGQPGRVPGAGAARVGHAR